MNKAAFNTRRTHLLPLLKKMIKPLSQTGKYAAAMSVLELTVTDGLLTLVIPGVKLSVKCKTKGTAKATIGLVYFLDIVKGQKLMMECFIADDTLSVNGLSVHAQTTFFKDDSILRSIKMPINYTDWHLLQLELEGFTDEEILFNGLLGELSTAKRRVKTNMTKAYNLLKEYGVKKLEIEEMVRKKVENL